MRRRRRCNDIVALFGDASGGSRPNTATEVLPQGTGGGGGGGRVGSFYFRARYSGLPAVEGTGNRWRLYYIIHMPEPPTRTFLTTWDLIAIRGRSLRTRASVCVSAGAPADSVDRTNIYLCRTNCRHLSKQFSRDSDTNYAQVPGSM